MVKVYKGIRYVNYKETHNFPRGLRANLIRFDETNGCAFCHAVNERIAIHHIIHWRKFANIPEKDWFNLEYVIRLCPSCHAKIQGFEEFRKIKSPFMDAWYKFLKDRNKRIKRGAKNRKGD